MLIEAYGESLLDKAYAMEPVVGRDKEIDEVIAILCRQKKNNPALIGEPGVGKTAIVEGLAQRMSTGKVPPQLRTKRLYSLSMARLVAGTKYRGEFEERLNDLLRELRRSDDVIIFIDEMHTIIGAGAAEGGIDASNILKPALSRGEVQIIGATTLDEYRKDIEKDPALARRFRCVTISEPDMDTMNIILNSVKPNLEKHHNRKIKPEALEDALKLSIKYIPDAFLPDKAIDLLDEATAHAVMTHNHAVSSSDVAWVVSARTGIPAGRLTEDEKEHILNLESTLKSKIYGQDEAVKVVAKSVRRGLSGLKDESRPISTMLFSGSTGVGKTEMCRVLAEELFGSKDTIIRLDMSEYMEKHSVARLIGAPPGYIGHEEGGKLTEAVRRRPYSLVLFDELEKAHPDVINILLQIMEEGCLTDSVGRKVSFKNAIVVMTSNIGGEVKSNGIGFNSVSKTCKMTESLYNTFSPEFLGRIDEIVCFDSLAKDSMEHIASKYLAQLQSRISCNNINLTLPKDLSKLLVTKMSDTSGGARQMRRIVQNYVEDPLADYLLRCNPTPTTVHGIIREDKVYFSKDSRHSIIRV